jgi:hypothetical protein
MERMGARGAPRAGYASAAAASDAYGAAPAEEDLLPALMDELSFFQDARPAAGGAPASSGGAAAAAAAQAQAVRPRERSLTPPRRGVDVDALLGAGLDTAALLAQLEQALLVRGTPLGTRAHTRSVRMQRPLARKPSASHAARACVCIAALPLPLR